ncbi:hypothetical protein ACQP25_17160 [Microtetraspora malaysiensis]|uniref:hypothetical protein n=1 Tax=Microtetraspora malaysiensis TaxID=161358 RepID=UPI003D9020FF
MNAPSAYDDAAYPVWIPPLVEYRPAGQLDARGVYLLAWRKTGEEWEALVTWTTTAHLASSPPIHAKHVEWVPDSKIKQVPAEQSRGRYKQVPRFAGEA